jgi:hypothetical protein
MSSELDNSFLIGAAHNNGPMAIVHNVLQRDDLARGIGATRKDHVVGLIQNHFGADVQLGAVQFWVQRDAHLATCRVNVDGAIFVAPEESSVRRRWLGELVDLFAQVRDVLTRLTQGVRQLLVLGDGLGQLTLGFEQPFFQGADPFRGVVQLAS